MKFENFSELDKQDYNAGWFFIHALMKLKEEMGLPIMDTSIIPPSSPLNIEFKVNGIEFPFVSIVNELYRQMLTIREERITKAVKEELKNIFNIDCEFYQKQEEILKQYLDHLESKLPKSE